MVTKKWYQSKTVWLNILGTFIAILGYFTPDVLLTIGLDPIKFTAIISLVVTIGNVLLRSKGQPTVISTEKAGTPVPEKTTIPTNH